MKPRQPIGCENESTANQVPSPAGPQRVLEDEIALLAMLILSNHTLVGEDFYRTSSQIRYLVNAQSKQRRVPYEPTYLNPGSPCW